MEGSEHAPSPSNCPNRDKLASYILGELPEEAIRSVGTHAEQCSDCQARLNTLDELQDGLISTIRRVAPEQPGSPDPELEELLGLVESFGAKGVEERPKEALRASTREGGEADAEHILGQYQLLEDLGHGGMGTVYKAFHPSLKRTVAVKVLPKHRMTNPHAVNRFRREMEAVGRLDHPNIVRAHDAGESEGRPFLVMELLEGVTLSRVVRSLGPLSVPDACEVIRQAALGLQHAHEHGLVHRDVKPSNLMLTRDGTVKVLDLGLARVGWESAADMAGSQHPATTTPSGEDITSAGQTLGTVDYMAPEQVSDTHTVDIRADIYSLGCTLYALLAGRAPFSGSECQETSERMAAHVDRPFPAITEIRTDVPGPLAAVFDRLVAKDPADRFAAPVEVSEAIKPYAAGSDLAALLERALAAQAGLAAKPGQVSLPARSKRVAGPLGARHQPAPARLSRRRRRRLLALAIGGLALIMFLSIVLSIFMRKGMVKIEFTDVQAASGCDVFIDDEKIRIENLGRPITLKPGEHELLVKRGDLEVAARKFTIYRGNNPALVVELEPDRVRASSGGATEPELARPSYRLGFARRSPPISKTALVSRPAAIDGVKSWTIETRSHREEERDMAFSPDGRVLAVGGPDGMIRLMDARTGRVFRVLAGHDDWIDHVAFSRDGKRLASGGDDRMVRLWEVSTGRLLHTLEGHTYVVDALAWSPDGSTVASAEPHGRVLLWDSQTGSLRSELRGGGTSSLVFSSDGRRIAAGSHEGVTRLWDVESRQLRNTLTVRTGAAWVLGFTPDGEALFTGDSSGRLQLWDCESGEPLRELNSPKEGTTVEAMALAPDGKTFATADDQGKVRLCDVPSGKLVRIVPTGQRIPCALVWSPDGQRLAIAAKEGGRIQLLNIGRRRPFRAEEVSRADVPCIAYGMPSVALSPDGQTLAWAGKGSLRLLHIQTARVLHTFPGTYFCVAFSPDGKFVAAPDRAVQKVYIWDAVEGTARAVLSCPEVHALTWSPDGRMLAYGGGDGVVRWSDLSGSSQPRTFEGHTALVRALAISPDGETLASGGADRTVRLWSIKTGRLLHELRGHDETVFGLYGLSFDQEGKLLASASPKMVRIWEVSSGQPLNAFPQNSCDVRTLAWSPDGKMIAIGYFGQPGARILDPRSGLLSLFPPTPAGVRSLAWSGNSQVIAYACGEGFVRLWSPGTECLGGTLLSLRLKQWLAISPDGHFRGSPGVEQELVYVVETEQGQETLTPQEFTARYGWENEPDKVCLWPSAETQKAPTHDAKGKGGQRKRAE